MTCPYSREDRLERLKHARSLVVKVGSAVLTTPEGLNMPVLRNLAQQLSALAREGRRVTLVSSGAVAAGPGRLFPQATTEWKVCPASRGPQPSGRAV